MPLTETTPKCCLRPGRHSILEWQISQLKVAGIDEVVVVTGFGHDQVDDVMAGVEGIRTRTLFNPFYRLSDNLGTCWIARHEMTGPFVLINGDSLFEAAVLQHLIQESGRFPITLASDQKASYDSDDMKIWSMRDRLVRVSKQLDSSRVNGESIGMMTFSPSGARQFVGTIEELMKQGDGLKRWYLSAIDLLARSGQVGVSSIHGLSWCEVDDAIDLAFAEKVVSTWPNPPGRESKKATADDSAEHRLAVYADKTR
jgi:choline kinase